MQFWIDFETAAGAKVGEGPIISATGWEHTPRLDGAGRFSFKMPASDPMSTHKSNKLVARCRGILDGAVTEFGMGIIDNITLDPGSPSMLLISGPDIMAELANVSVHDLVVCERKWTDLSVPTHGLLAWVRVDNAGHPDPTCGIPLAHDGNDGTYETIYLQSNKVSYIEFGSYLYIGYDARWDWADILFAGGDYAEEANKVLYSQYYNETDGWKADTIESDGTDDGGTFRKNGIIKFTRPADWSRYNAIEAGGDWFWRRLKLSRTGADDPSYTGYFKLAEVDVYADMPTTNGVNLIMAYAPATWTRTGYPATKSEKYLEFQGESVLEALLTLAEQGGTDSGAAVREHFRYSTTPRTIDWMGTTITASGVRAVAPVDAVAAEGADELVVIQSLQREYDSAEMITRVYPRSADGMGIGPATDSAPTGYTTGSVVQGIKTHYYVEHDAGVVAYGVIEQHKEFSELSLQQADSYTTHPIDLANQLLERAVEFLRTHAQMNQFYRLTITQFPALLRAGDTIEAVYHEYADGVHTVNIDTIAGSAPLFILAPTLRIDASGVGTIALEVSTIDRQLKTDAGVVVDLVRQNRKQGAASGNYATIAVTGGGQPPTAGPDIRVNGYQVSRAGAGVLLFSGSGAVLAEYAADATGLAAALAAAASGDIVEIPAGNITADVTVPDGVTLRGMGRNSKITGCLQLGDDSIIANLKVYQSVNTSDDVVGINKSSGTVEGYLYGVVVQIIQAGSGKALGVLASSGTLVWYGNTKIYVNGGTGSRWAAAAASGAAVVGNHGVVKAWIGA